ncbi:MAG: hypothetical protein ACI4SO_02800, partial [Muribaculaceae bacterium]
IFKTFCKDTTSNTPLSIPFTIFNIKYQTFTFIHIPSSFLYPLFSTSIALISTILSQERDASRPLHQALLPPSGRLGESRFMVSICR